MKYINYWRDSDYQAYLKILAKVNQLRKLVEEQEQAYLIVEKMILENENICHDQH